MLAGFHTRRVVRLCFHAYLSHDPNRLLVLHGSAPHDDAHHLPLPTMRLNVVVLTSAALVNALKRSAKHCCIQHVVS